MPPEALETSTDSAVLPRRLRQTLEGILGKRVVRATPIGGGYTPARRLRIALEDGNRVFVKAATTDHTARWLRIEARVYDALAGSAFLAERLAWHDDSDEPFLVLEDLSESHWPPPWNPGQVESTLAALASVRESRHRIPFALERIEDDRANFASWHRVATEPSPFLSLGLCSRAWLEAALPPLIAAEAVAPLAGEDLLHLDVRSDNVCFRPGSGEAVLVDWNWVCIGNRDLDIAGWLSSLHSETGILPETLLPGGGGFAALLSGFWAYRAGTPPPPGAPRVREVQKRQLQSALPWAVRALDLPPLRGR
ncbi:MAG: aminoglycoside phosphotransferase family protein [Cytophagales bacterium]|nr:aminoglycoside phosphotransferase family protein [Armatimonadota bacterium]